MDLNKLRSPNSAKDLKIWKESVSKVPLCQSFVHCVLVCVGCENLLFSQAKCPPVEELPSTVKSGPKEGMKIWGEGDKQYNFI